MSAAAVWYIAALCLQILKPHHLFQYAFKYGEHENDIKNMPFYVLHIHFVHPKVSSMKNILLMNDSSRVDTRGTCETGILEIQYNTCHS